MTDQVAGRVGLDHFWPDPTAEVIARAKAGDPRAVRCVNAYGSVVQGISGGGKKEPCAVCRSPLRTVGDIGACSVAHFDGVSVGIPFCVACASSQDAVSARADDAVRRLVNRGLHDPANWRWGHG
jgi:hypothetical protein